MAGCTGLLSCSLAFTVLFIFTVKVQSTPFEYIFRLKAGGLKRSNVSAATSAHNTRVRDEPQDRNIIRQVEDANARRIQTLYQLLEHRPEAQSKFTTLHKFITYL